MPLTTTLRMRMLRERSGGCKICLCFDGRKFEARASTGPTPVAVGTGLNSDSALDALAHNLIKVADADATTDR